MTLHGTPQSSDSLTVSIHLLDSGKGHSVRTWTFHDQAVLNIGRLEDNDVVVSDPAVSRRHATLSYANGEWELLSVGKHGVLIDDERVESARLLPDTSFKLGPNGPTLMFECVAPTDAASQQSTTTVEFDTFAIGSLGFDRQTAAEQVRRITDDNGFQKLLEQAAALRKRRSDSQG